MGSILNHRIHLVGLTSHYITQRGKIAENTVYACALLSAHTDTHGTKGKKGMISRMSDQANITQCMVCIIVDYRPSLIF